MNLIEQGISITVASTRHANSSTDYFGNELNMANYDGVCFVAMCSGSMSTSAPTSLYGYESTSASGTFSALSGYATVAESSNRLLILDIVKPLQQYIKPRITRNSTKCDVSGIIAIRYMGRKGAVSYPSTESTVADSTCLVSPTS